MKFLLIIGAIRLAFRFLSRIGPKTRNRLKDLAEENEGPSEKNVWW